MWCSYLTYVFSETRNKIPINECHELYPGPHPESELETKAIVERLTDPFPWLLCSDEKLEAKDHLDLFVTLHSYDNSWIFTDLVNSNSEKDKKLTV